MALFNFGDSMKKIRLSQGKVTLVDDIDYKFLDQFGKWQYHLGYAIHNIYGGCIRMHRVILERMGITNIQHVDHINGNGLDNRRCNLRPATPSQNKCNGPAYKNNIAGFRGVSWYARDNTWRAAIAQNGMKKHLGYFDDPWKAAQAYNEAAIKYYGEFARLNEDRRIKNVEVTIERRIVYV